MSKNTHIQELQARFLAETAMLYLELQHAAEDVAADVLRMLERRYDRELDAAAQLDRDSDSD